MKSYSNLSKTLFFVLLALTILPNKSQAQTGGTGTTLGSLATIILYTDSNPQETTFELYDLATGNVLLTASGSMLPPNGSQMLTAWIPNGGCIKGDLSDSAGDGGSDFVINYQGNTYSTSLGTNFGYLNTIVAGPAGCSDFSALDDFTNYLVRAEGGLQIGNSNNFEGSILGNPVTGDICMGIRNDVDGWVRGSKVGIPASNQIDGLNNIDAFGLDLGYDVCSGSNPMPAGGLHVTPTPMPNVGHDCLPDDLTEYGDEDLYLSGVNTEHTLDPDFQDDVREMGDVVVTNGATLYLYNEYYNFRSLVVSGGKVIYNGGGGTLCDIFIRAQDVVVTFNSTVHANINCDWINIGNDNEIIGEIAMEDPTTPLVIGDRNTFKEPICPPCQAPAAITLKNNVQVEKELLYVWPNPVNGNQFQVQAPGGSELEIFDMLGKRMFVGEMPGQSKEMTTLSIDTFAFSEGMYISKVTMPEGRVLNRKFMVGGK